MDKFLKSGYGGEPEDSADEATRTGILRTDAGTSMVVYPTLRQAIVVVASGKVFCLEAA